MNCLSFAIAPMGPRNAPPKKQLFRSRFAACEFIQLFGTEAPIRTSKSSTEYPNATTQTGRSAHPTNHIIITSKRLAVGAHYAIGNTKRVSPIVAISFNCVNLSPLRRWSDHAYLEEN